jgi:hypothetical protein
MNLDNPELQDLLSNEPVCLSTLFSSPNFWIWCQGGTPALLDFLFRPDTGARIISGVFETPGPLTNAFTHLLTSEYPRIQTRLLNCEPLPRHLHAFMRDSNPNAHRPKLAGTFSQIVRTVLRLSDGRFLTKLPNLVDFLQRNLHLIAYRDLLTHLLVDWPAAAPFSAEFASNLLQTAHTPDLIRNSLALIRSVITQKPAQLPPLKSARILQLLLNLAASPDADKFTSLKSLELVRDIFRRPLRPELRSVLSSFDDSFQLEIVDVRTAVLFELFPIRVSKHADDFVNHRLSTLQSQSFLNAVRSLSLIEFADFVESSDFQTKVIAAFGTSRTDGVFTELARYTFAVLRRTDLFSRSDCQAFEELHLGTARPPPRVYRPVAQRDFPPIQIRHSHCPEQWFIARKKFRSATPPAIPLPANRVGNNSIPEPPARVSPRLSPLHVMRKKRARHVGGVMDQEAQGERRPTVE